jgi:hypothetical protein
VLAWAFVAKVLKRRRVVAGGGGGARTTVAAARKGGVETSLDDAPISVTASRDGKWLAVSMPWEVWILDAKTLEFRRSIELKVEHPCVAEGGEGALWIGGQHLHRANAFTTGLQKVGTKLGGYVDQIAILRPDLLCGVGGQGELLWDIGEDAPTHKRKSSHPDALRVIATADERAVFIDGSECAWVLDPNHPSGYMQLRLPTTSDHFVREEGLVALGLSRRGRCLLAARDGAVAWTESNLRIAAERFPRVSGAASRPLSISADERWVYVLRPGGLLQRLLIEQPEAYRRQEERRSREKGQGSGRGRPRRARERTGPGPSSTHEEEIEALASAQQCRLEKPASCFALLGADEPGSSDEATRLVVAGAKSDGQLGRIWSVELSSLAWQDLEMRPRALHDAEDRETRAAPSFVTTRSKLEGPPISSLSVDDVLGGRVDYWVTRGQGSLLERPTVVRGLDEILPGVALLIPAMLRFREGTARPGLFLWPGEAREDRPAPDPMWLTWGDKPRQWIALDTPQIREQRWSRSDVFPLHAAMRIAAPTVPGLRSKLPKRWHDAKLFTALVDECKHQLKVLW